MTIPIIEANGARIPALGFGTWRLTGASCVAAVETALAVGYRHIDTARMYGNEREVGEALRASPLPRDEVFVTTKVWRDQIGAGALERSAEASLRDLGLDQVDLLLIHWPNDSIPLKDSIGALCNARRRGLARHESGRRVPGNRGVVALRSRRASVGGIRFLGPRHDAEPRKRVDRSNPRSRSRQLGSAGASLEWTAGALEEPEEIIELEVEF